MLLVHLYSMLEECIKTCGDIISRLYSKGEAEIVRSNSIVSMFMPAYDTKDMITRYIDFWIQFPSMHTWFPVFSLAC